MNRDTIVASAFNVQLFTCGGCSAHEYFMGSVADRVVKHAPCPVLVYRR